MFHACKKICGRDPFKVLGLARSCSKAQVKAKYRELAKQFHPDMVVAQSGSSDKVAGERMEEINRAYNMLMKEGAYERLHMKGYRAAAGDRSPDPPAARDGEGSCSGLSEEEYSKLAGLDPSTERVTPDGKYMYENRDTGQWVLLSRPIFRAKATRYQTFSGQQDGASDQLKEELRTRSAEKEKQARENLFATGLKGWYLVNILPFNNPLALAACFLLYVMLLYALYYRHRSWKDRNLKRENYIGGHQKSDEALLKDVLLGRNAASVVIAAASLVVLAAAVKKSERDPVVPFAAYPCEEPPPDTYHLANPA